MKRVIYGTLTAALILLSAAAPSISAEIKPVGSFGWVGIGKVYLLGEGHIYWVGEFTGTFFADKGGDGLLDRSGIKCPGFQEIDFAKKTAHSGGTCIFNDPKGDQAYLTWKCEGDGSTCKGTNQFVGGTGKYKDASGSGTFHAGLYNWKDGTTTGWSIFNRE